MRTAFRILLATASLGLATSCYYSPYDDYGYSSSYGFSGGGSTAFIYTSSDRWLYDPVVRCCYALRRSCYYDPWVGGYYPQGYCPQPVRGVPHPYGWNGRGACPLPRNVSSRHLSRNYDRLAHYRDRNYGWAANAHTHQVANHNAWSQNRFQAASNYRRHGGRATHVSPRAQQPTPHAQQPQVPNWRSRDDRRDNATPFWNQRGRQQPNVQSREQSPWPGIFGRGQGGSPSRDQPSARPRAGFNQPVATPGNQPRQNFGGNPSRSFSPPPQAAPQQPRTNPGNQFDQRREAFQNLQNLRQRRGGRS